MLVAVTAVFWAAAIVRAWRWSRSPDNPAVRATAIALLAIALALTLDIPSVRNALAASGSHSQFGINPGDLAKQIAIVVGAWACQSLLLHLTRGPEATRASEARRALLAGTVAAVSTAVYLTRGFASGGPDAGDAGIAQPWATEARLLVLAYAGTVLFFVARLCWRHSAGGSLGRGVAVMGLGCAVMVVFALTRFIAFALAQYADVLLPGLFTAGDYLQVLGLAVIAAGTLVPWLGGIARRRRYRRVHDELEPLWQVVSARVPDVVFAAGTGQDATSWALGRRVVEIQDGLLILAPHLKLDGVGSSAEQLAGALMASTEPARVVAHGPAQTTNAGTAAVAVTEKASSLQWLTEVSRAVADIQVPAAR